MATTDIKKHVKSIIVCSSLLIFAVTFCWFYELITQTPFPSKISGYFLALFIMLPTSIIINAKSILKKAK